MKQWRFQFHLSTAIVLMFAAGALMWGNTRGRKDVMERNLTYIPYDEASEDLPGDPIFINYGWPFDAAWQRVGASMSGQGWSSPHSPDLDRIETFFSIPGEMRFSAKHIIWNAAVALALLATIAFIADLIARRRTSARA